MLDATHAPADPNLDGEPSAEFYRQFPDGKVPIRFGIGQSALQAPCWSPERERVVRDTFVSSYERDMALFDAVHDLGMDVDVLEHLRTEFENAEPSSTRDRTRSDLIARMMQWGMTLVQIARYVGVTDDEIVGALFMGWSRNLPAAVILHADEVLADDPTYPLLRLARELHIDREPLRTLRLARQLGRSGGRRGCGEVAHNEVMHIVEGAAA